MKERTMAHFFRWLYWTVAFGVTVAALAGCSLSPSADVITAMGKDPASGCLRVTTVYGTLTYARGNPIGGDTTCDIFTTKTATTPTSVGIPMVITPTFRIAPGTTQ